MENRPDWWDWELELTPHLLKRMVDRVFNESDLRTMLEDAIDVQSLSSERYQVSTMLNEQQWIVIVEPDPPERKILIVTAYPCD